MPGSTSPDILALTATDLKSRRSKAEDPAARQPKPLLCSVRDSVYLAAQSSRVNPKANSIRIFDIATNLNIYCLIIHSLLWYKVPFTEMRDFPE
jgi:hypothetical protein